MKVFENELFQEYLVKYINIPIFLKYLVYEYKYIIFIIYNNLLYYNMNTLYSY